MAENPSKRISTRSRLPPVTFKATQTGLLIRVTISPEEAQAIADKAASKVRAKASASQAIISALRALTKDRPRKRTGILQAEIPSHLKAELSTLTESAGRSATDLILEILESWFDPRTGEPRLRKGSAIGPKRYRSYVKATDDLYFAAVKVKALTRLQIEVGTKIINQIERALGPNRISKGRFLTALVKKVVDSHLEDGSDSKNATGEDAASENSTAPDHRAPP